MAKTPTENLTISLPGTTDRRCAAQHFGAWAVEPKWFKSAMDAVRAGTLKPAKIKSAKKKAKADYGDEDDDLPECGYKVVDGMAIICIDGQMTKHGSSFGGCSTIAVRQAVRDAAADWAVKSILMHICSPGGTASGTADLASDIIDARGEKPVNAYIADMGCSAAYWIASQCQRIYANVTAVVGSIGTYCILEDDTALQEQIGIKYRVVSTAQYKGLGGDGQVSDVLIADVQREVDELNQPFLSAVASGRGKMIPDLAIVADGRAHVGEQAKSLGLVDEIASLDAAIAAISKEVKKMNEQSFSAYAAEHPEAVASFLESGKKAGFAAGTSDERARCLGIFGAHGLSDHAAVASVTAGHDIETAKTIADTAAKAVAVAKAEAKASADQQAAAIAEKDKEIKRLQFEAEGRRPVGGATAASATTPDPLAAIPEDADPDTRASMEYEADPKIRAEFPKKRAYVKWRASVLRGNISVLKGNVQPQTA